MERGGGRGGRGEMERGGGEEREGEERREREEEGCQGGKRAREGEKSERREGEGVKFSNNLSFLYHQIRYWYLLAKPLPHTDVTMEAASGDQNIAMETDSSSVSMDTTQQQQQRPSVLKYVFDTLSSPKASSKVCGCIMEMSVNLLTLCGEEEGGAPETMATGETGDGSVLSSGENLIAPFVHLFLDYLRRVIGEGFRGRKARNVSGNFLEKEFVILSR